MIKWLSTLPLAVYGWYHLTKFGIRPDIIVMWVPALWILVGIKVANAEEITQTWKGVLVSWGWPLWLAMFGFYRHKNYSLVINNVKVHELSGTEVRGHLRAVITNHTNVIKQIQFTLLAILIGFVISGILLSSILFWAIVITSKVDTRLVIEAIRTWVENGYIPYYDQIQAMGRSLVIGVSLLFLKNIYKDEFMNKIRVAARIPTTGNISLERITPNN